MNTKLALLAGLGGLGIVLALGRSTSAAVSGPPLPLVWMPTDYEEAPRLGVDFIILGVEGIDSDLAHYTIDGESIIQRAEEKNVVKATIEPHVDERALYLNLSSVDEKVLDAAAWVVAHAASRWSVPLASLDGGKLDAGARGVTTFEALDKSNLLTEKLGSSYPSFPMDKLLALVKRYR